MTDGPPGFKYLWYEELDEAKAQSRAKWTQKLGHPKHPQDVTEFIWPWISPPDDSYWLLQIPESDFHMLGPSEEGDLLEPDDPLVQACFQRRPRLGE